MSGHRLVAGAGAGCVSIGVRPAPSQPDLITAPEESEIARLKRELERVREERDILKKAAAYFAKELP